VSKEQPKHRDYWVGEAFFAGGYGWGIDEELRTICLGKEEDIVPVLKGKANIPDSLSPRQRVVLSQILEDMEVTDAGATEVGGRRPVRTRPIGVTRHRQKDSRRAKTRKRFPRR